MELKSEKHLMHTIFAIILCIAISAIIYFASIELDNITPQYLNPFTILALLCIWIFAIFKHYK